MQVPRFPTLGQSTPIRVVKGVQTQHYA